jgi:hypothetical protein
MKSLKIIIPLPVLSFLVLLIPGCSNTSVTDTWKEPGLNAPFQFNKIVALAIQQDSASTRVAEDEMTRQIGSRAVPAYTILTAEDRADVKKVIEKLKAAGADGAVTMKLLDKRIETYVSRDSWGTFHSYYDRSYGYSEPTHGYRSRPYADRITVFMVETNIYSVDDGKLIWSAISRSEPYDPENVRQVVHEIAQAVRAELQKEGLIPSAEVK